MFQYQYFNLMFLLKDIYYKDRNCVVLYMNNMLKFILELKIKIYNCMEIL